MGSLAIDIAATAARRLPAKLDISAAPALRDLLVSALEEAGPIVLDASAVTSIDTACLQVLCAFARDAADNARPFALQAPSPALLETSRRLALGSLLALD